MALSASPSHPSLCILARQRKHGKKILSLIVPCVKSINGAWSCCKIDPLSEAHWITVSLLLSLGLGVTKNDNKMPLFLSSWLWPDVLNGLFSSLFIEAALKSFLHSMSGIQYHPYVLVLTHSRNVAHFSCLLHGDRILYGTIPSMSRFLLKFSVLSCCPPQYWWHLVMSGDIFRFHNWGWEQLAWNGWRPGRLPNILWCIDCVLQHWMILSR